jgi:cell division protein FtsB
MMKTQSIRELKALQAKALEAYHAEYQRLEAEIQAIRQARGTKLKEKAFEEYYEAGRSRMPVPGMGQSY